MRTIGSVTRRVFFYGAFFLLGLAVIEKAANLMRYTLLRGTFTAARLLEYAAIALLFTIAMQLNEIRLLLGSRSQDPMK